MDFENRFEELRKEVLDNFDHDAEILQRKILELNEEYDHLVDTEVDFYSKELQLANNNEEEILRRVKVKAIEEDHAKKMERYKKEYQEKVEDLKSKFEPKMSKPYYYKWTYIGPVKKYERILCGLSYFVKLLEDDTLEVFRDVKFSSYVDTVDYIPDEWKEIV